MKEWKSSGEDLRLDPDIEQAYEMEDFLDYKIGEAFERAHSAFSTLVAQLGDRFREGVYDTIVVEGRGGRPVADVLTRIMCYVAKEHGHAAPRIIEVHPTDVYANKILKDYNLDELGNRALIVSEVAVFGTNVSKAARALHDADIGVDAAVLFSTELASDYQNQWQELYKFPPDHRFFVGKEGTGVRLNYLLVAYGDEEVRQETLLEGDYYMSAAEQQVALEIAYNHAENMARYLFEEYMD